MAEEVGFEPTVPCGTSHFKCGALDHSATLPYFGCAAVESHYVLWFMRPKGY